MEVERVYSLQDSAHELIFSNTQQGWSLLLIAAKEMKKQIKSSKTCSESSGDEKERKATEDSKRGERRWKREATCGTLQCDYRLWPM